MKKDTPITEIMTKDLITLTVKDDLVTAEKLFKKHKIRHIPIVENEKLIGILSYTDLLRISYVDAVFEDEEYVESEVYNMFTLEQVMVKNLIVLNMDATIKEVAEILSKKEFHALPIINKGKLAGIVTSTDLINYLLQQFEE